MKKKLLILGGTSISRQIVYAAHEMEIDVYVTDYCNNSPAKLIADKSFMVSATDVDGVVELIQDENIDGVLMGYADLLLPYYVDICNKANIPSYANLKAIDITTDKAKFKSYCKDFNIPVVPEYSYEDVTSGRVQYPILVKPVDNSGARGIYICHDRTEFDIYYVKAMSFSPSKNVLIEQFMHGKEATIFYYLHEGIVYLLGIGDRHMLKFSDSLLQLPVGYTFPSKETANFQETENQNVVKMFEALGMKEGMVFMQAFNEDDQLIIYEMGYRLTGSIEHHLMDTVYGFNHLKAIINYAVGNDVDISNLQSLDPRECCMANVTLLLKSGTIAAYMGIDEVENIQGVIHVHESYPIGQVIDDAIMGTLAQVGVRILLKASSHNDLINLMDTIRKTIRILSVDGNDMLIDNYSYKEICNL